MRSHLLRSFLSAYIILTILGGGVSYLLLENYMREQAEASAKSLAGVLTSGGFSDSEPIRRRMAELTGYEFETFFATPGDEFTLPDGSVSQAFPGGILVVYYDTPAYQSALRTVLLLTISIAILGILIFAAVTWRISHSLGNPLEQLAQAATAIGQGDWEEPVPIVGRDEVQHLALDLENMRHRLLELNQRQRDAERLATLGTFTATIAHEVRNPLSAIRLSIQVLQGDNPNHPSLQLIDDEIERLDHIVDELLGFSRGMNVQLTDCDLVNVASDVSRLLHRQARHAGVDIRLEGSGQVQADPRRLRQMMLNLVLNAIQALHGSESDGLVIIRLTDDGFEVIDNGPGVPTERREDLFQAFASSKSQGTGLGLHLAHLIADAHGASLTYEDVRPHGSCFRFSGLASLA